MALYEPYRYRPLKPPKRDYRWLVVAGVGVLGVFAGTVVCWTWVRDVVRWVTERW